MLKKIYSKILDILYPIVCIICNKQGSLLCPTCLADIPINPKVLKNPTTSLSSVTVCTSYKNESVRTIIKVFKYNGLYTLAQPLSRIMTACLDRKMLEKDLTLIAIPLHRRKRSMRGYNQSQLLAKIIAQELDIKTDSELARMRYTTSQSKLSRADRMTNVRKIFSYRGERAPHHVLLIDDITTTFSTLDDAARALKQKGALNISAIVVAQNKD